MQLFREYDKGDSHMAHMTWHDCDYFLLSSHKENFIKEECSC